MTVCMGSIGQTESSQEALTKTLMDGGMGFQASRRDLIEDTTQLILLVLNRGRKKGRKESQRSIMVKTGRKLMVAILEPGGTRMLLKMWQRNLSYC